MFSRRQTSCSEGGKLMVDDKRRSSDSQCFQLRTMLRKSAGSSSVPQASINSSGSSSSSSSKDLHAVLQARIMQLETELELEKQRHATTAARLMQEQEMLAVLARRLAAVETTAGNATCDMSELQQLLQAEQHLHDVTLNALHNQLRVAQELRHQLSSLALSTSTTASAAASLGRTCKQFAFRTVCVLTGVAAAAAASFPGKSLPPTVLTPVTSLPSTVLSLAAPAATAAIAAEATTVALRALGGLVGLLHCQKRQQQQQQVPGAAAPFNSAAVSAWAAGPVSFNCWEFDEVSEEMAYGEDPRSQSCSCSDSSNISSSSSTSSRRGHEAEEREQCTILPWDDIQSEMSYDQQADSMVIVSEPKEMVDVACQCNKAGQIVSPDCMLAEDHEASNVELAQKQRQQQPHQQQHHQQQQQQGHRRVHAGVLYLAP